ncbi:hypothetical protein L1987_20190 [Smallanthus sonchifolius]|uniref:Uncharacterized protein n=1 Tax=Smallanthus sonchifolius TaxID=185202 RepID=A0ACB9IRD2_9ASTR|nr:hypothetical protein L1987_20190 [Smallanthus sonchifolius]
MKAVVQSGTRKKAAEMVAAAAMDGDRDDRLLAAGVPEASVARSGLENAMDCPDLTKYDKMFVALKLNGGLGTTIGCTSPKELIFVFPEENRKKTSEMRARERSRHHLQWQFFDNKHYSFDSTNQFCRLYKNKTLEGISDIRDESDQRIVIESNFSA